MKQNSRPGMKSWRRTIEKEMGEKCAGKTWNEIMEENSRPGMKS